MTESFENLERESPTGGPDTIADTIFTESDRRVIIL